MKPLLFLLLLWVFLASVGVTIVAASCAQQLNAHTRLKSFSLELHR